MHKHWHCVFDDSLRQTWISFCYRFYGSLVNSWTLSTPYVRCHSYFSCDFKAYRDSVLAYDFRSVVTQFSLTISCVNDDCFLYWFRSSTVNYDALSIPSVSRESVLKMISRSIVTQFSLPISGSAMAYCVWRFHASNMNIFLLSVSRLAREFFDAVDPIRQLPLILQ